MNFSVLRRLDFQDFNFSYYPIAMCGNGGVLLQTNGGTAEVTTFGGLRKILFGDVPRYYVYPASGSVIALDPPMQPEASLIAISDSNVVLSTLPIGIYEPPSGVFHAFALNPVVDAQVTTMNSRGQILGFDALAEGSFPWLMNPAPIRGELLTSQFAYTNVPLSEASEKAGITKGLGFGISALAINDVGWVLLAGAEGPGAIVDMSDPSNPNVLYENSHLVSGRATFLSNTGWVAQLAATVGSSAFSVYDSSTGKFYTAQIEDSTENNWVLSVGSINGSGQVVGTAISVDADDINAGRGFYWDPINGTQFLTTVSLPSGDRIIGAAGINDAGLIAAMVVAEKDNSNYGVLLNTTA